MPCELVKDTQATQLWEQIAAFVSGHLPQGPSDNGAWETMAESAEMTENELTGNTRSDSEKHNTIRSTLRLTRKEHKGAQTMQKTSL